MWSFSFCLTCSLWGLKKVEQSTIKREHQLLTLGYNFYTFVSMSSILSSYLTVSTKRTLGGLKTIRKQFKMFYAIIQASALDLSELWLNWSGSTLWFSVMTGKWSYIMLKWLHRLEWLSSAISLSIWNEWTQEHNLKVVWPHRALRGPIPSFPAQQSSHHVGKYSVQARLTYTCGQNSMTSILIDFFFFNRLCDQNIYPPCCLWSSKSQISGGYKRIQASLHNFQFRHTNMYEHIPSVLYNRVVSV